MTDTKTQTTLLPAGEMALPAGDTPEPFDFAVYAGGAAASGVWDVPAAHGADR